MTGGDERPNLLDNSGKLLNDKLVDRRSNDVTSGKNDDEDQEVAQLQGALINTEKVSVNNQKSALEAPINSMGNI